MLTATVAADLTGLTLQGGVYAASSKGALSLTGTVTLDANGNEDTVFIFQTNSSLITGPGSSINLINGAQQCNVYWQVGSSATLGSSSTMVGSVLALTSVTLEAGVTVNGRVTAQTGSVTLISDTFHNPTCARAPVVTTTSANGAGVTTAPSTPNIPATGSASDAALLVAVIAITTGALATWVAVRRNPMH